jgi:hypothetical protein
MRFHTTKHGSFRVMERELSFEHAKNVVKYGTEKTVMRPGVHGGAIYRFKKTDDGLTLVVVAEVKNNECWIMTAYYEN